MSESLIQITPDALARHLLHSGCGLEELLDHFHCPADEIAATLAGEQFQSHQKLRTDLALSQARLRAAAALPACIEKLLQLTDSEKPEVARRSIMAVMDLAGISPKNPPPAPEPPLPPIPEKELTEIRSLAKLTLDQREELKHLATCNLRLKQISGINLFDLNSRQFDGFTSHVERFFKDLGIQLAGRGGLPVPWRNSVANPEVQDRAHKILAQKSAPAAPHNINQTPENTASNPQPVSPASTSPAPLAPTGPDPPQ